MPGFDPALLRAFAQRDWRRARDAKRAYWRARLDRGGLAEAIRVTESLRGPDDHREEDLETHQRVAEALAKTAPRRASTRGVARVR
jgi:hypothetical protein